jgi:hypothetical protein
VGGVMTLFAFIGLSSVWLFGFALIRIFRRAATPEGGNDS